MRVMPELPEVEGLAAALTRRLRGHRVEALRVNSIAVLKTFDPPVSALAGLEVTGLSRRGKYLVVETPPLAVVVHLSRGGWMRWRDAPTAGRTTLRGPLAAELRMDGGGALAITEQGRDKRLAIWVVRDPGDVPQIASLGPEPLAERFGVAAMAAALRGAPGGTIKHVLADQHVIAGIGNAYSDEMLHAARLSPFRRAADLSDDEVARLHGSLSLLRDAAARARELDLSELKDDKRGGMRVHGRSGLPCPVCGETIRDVWLGERSLQYCPGCQTGGRVLADRRLSRLLR